MSNGGRIEIAQRMAGHANAKAKITGIYDDLRNFRLGMFNFYTNYPI